ncbi:MAG: cytochrome c3 family protein [Bryobacteraceae bacterium]
MACHRSIKPESPSIQKLSAFASGNRKVPWVRVYQIPSYVFFSHKSHLAAGAGCKKCHGSVTDRDKLWKETDISMGGCMECHRKERASLDCNYCHDPRQ